MFNKSDVDRFHFRKYNINNLQYFLYRDRFATPVNIWSNCTACVIIEHYSREEFQSLDGVTKPREEACTTVDDDTNTDVTVDIANEVQIRIETIKDNKEDIALGA